MTPDNEPCAQPGPRLQATRAPLRAERSQAEPIYDELRAVLVQARGALAGLLKYRAHESDCAVGQTDFCTCGLKEVADSARATLAALSRFLPQEATK